MAAGEGGGSSRGLGSLTWLGLAITSLYLIGGGVLISIGDVKLAELSANEVGDFLAGVFAPLAFLWLVLGFFLQRQELAQSTKALWLQSEELAKSVEHQRELVEQTRRQVDAELETARRETEEAERQAQPLIVGTTSGSYTGVACKFDLRFRNTAATCTRVEISLNGAVVRKVAVLSAGETVEVSKLFNNSEDVTELRGIITYVDARGQRKGVQFFAPKHPKAGPNGRPLLGDPVIGEYLSLPPAVNG